MLFALVPVMIPCIVIPSAVSSACLTVESRHVVGHGTSSSAPCAAAAAARYACTFYLKGGCHAYGTLVHCTLVHCTVGTCWLLGMAEPLPALATVCSSCLGADTGLLGLLGPLAASMWRVRTCQQQAHQERPAGLALPGQSIITIRCRLAAQPRGLAVFACEPLAAVVVVSGAGLAPVLWPSRSILQPQGKMKGRSASSFT
jgi:hypothetical protein